jgi:hypothetical protein
LSQKFGSYIINLGYVDPFDYKFTIITKIELFKGYIDITYINKELELIPSIIIYLKRRKERSLRALIKHSRHQNKNNLNSKTSYFQHEKIYVGDFHSTHDLIIIDINLILEAMISI